MASTTTVPELITGIPEVMLHESHRFHLDSDEDVSQFLEYLDQYGYAVVADVVSDSETLMEGTETKETEQTDTERKQVALNKIRSLFWDFVETATVPPSEGKSCLSFDWSKNQNNGKSKKNGGKNNQKEKVTKWNSKKTKSKKNKSKSKDKESVNDADANVDAKS